MPVEYAIDAEDRLMSMNEAWDQFALANGAPHLVADAIRFQSIFNFIMDEDVRQMWQLIVTSVRKNKSSAEFDYRCDSPSEKRFMHMRVSFAQNAVNFHSVVIRTERQPKPEIFNGGRAFDHDLLMVCSWCKKIRLPEEEWVEPEIAAQRLSIFSENLFPQISHGICSACREKVLADFSAKT